MPLGFVEACERSSIFLDFTPWSFFFSLRSAVVSFYSLVAGCFRSDDDWGWHWGFGWVFRRIGEKREGF